MQVTGVLFDTMQVTPQCLGLLLLAGQHEGHVAVACKLCYSCPYFHMGYILQDTLWSKKLSLWQIL